MTFECSVTVEQAVLLTAASLRSFEITPLSEEDPFLYKMKMQWNKHSPCRWIVGAKSGEAKALYHLAVIRERQKRDAEAWELHLKAAAVTDPAQKRWAEKSKWRLENIPWLKDQSGKS